MIEHHLQDLTDLQGQDMRNLLHVGTIEDTHVSVRQVEDTPHRRLFLASIIDLDPLHQADGVIEVLQDIGHHLHLAATGTADLTRVLPVLADMIQDLLEENDDILPQAGILLQGNTRECKIEQLEKNKIRDHFLMLKGV